MARERRSRVLRRIGVLATAALLGLMTAVLAPAAPGGADGNEAPGAPLAFRSLTAGYRHTCALLDDGTVKCWGDNEYGQLGLGDTANRGDGANEMGDNLPVVSLGAGRTATAISAGYSHTCALLDNATVKCWGNNARGELGLGDTASRGDGANEMGDNLPVVSLGAGRTATAISAGGYHTCARLDNATVKCWGQNILGGLGLGDQTTRGDGANEMGDNLPAVSLGAGRTATAISAGSVHSCALLDNATVKCWGFNDHGQLGLGDTANRGDGPLEMGGYLPAVSLGAGRTATAIAAGDYHTCALLDNARVKCWGYNFYGQSGLGDQTQRGDGPNEMGDNLPAVNLGAGRSATAITVGDYHTCARLDNATVKCWGDNGFGQLGLGDTANRGDGANEMGDNLPAVSLGAGRTAAAITAGDYFTCARLDNRRIKCWGDNWDGQLGQGDTASRGDGANEMGDNLPAVVLFTSPADTTDPTVDLRTPAQGAVYARNQAVAADFSCADEVGGSGIDTCVGTAPDGSPVDTTSYGSHDFTVTATDNAANSAEDTHSYTVVEPRPDGRIKLGSGTFVGDGVYNTTGLHQTRSGSAPRGSSVTYTVKVQNDSLASDVLRLKGTASNTAFAVTYTVGTTNVTATMVAGTYHTPTLAPGATLTIKVVVKVKTTAPAGSSLTGTLTAKSNTDSTSKDTVKFVTRRA